MPVDENFESMYGPTAFPVKKQKIPEPVDIKPYEFKYESVVTLTEAPHKDGLSPAVTETNYYNVHLSRDASDPAEIGITMYVRLPQWVKERPIEELKILVREAAVKCAYDTIQELISTNYEFGYNNQV